MLAIIDNYDSFVYNLYQYAGEFEQDIKVFRNDTITAEQLYEMKPDAVILSPGPGRPENSKVCLEILDKLKGKLPILGICLGHQAIGYSFGGNVIGCKEILHGKTSDIQIKDCEIFNGLDKKATVMRYHSLIVDRDSLPDCLEITAETDDGIIMGLKHKKYEIYGLQFHPESILTQNGKKIIENFIKNIVPKKNL